MLAHHVRCWPNMKPPLVNVSCPPRPPLYLLDNNWISCRRFGQCVIPTSANLTAAPVSPAVQRKEAVTAHFISQQLLLFAFAWTLRQTAFSFELQDSLLPSSSGIMTAVQRQTAVAAYLKSKQLLLFVFQLQDSLLPSSTGILTAIQRQTETLAQHWNNTGPITYLKSYCCLSLSCRILFCHRVLACWPPCKDKQQ